MSAAAAKQSDDVPVRGTVGSYPIAGHAGGIKNDSFKRFDMAKIPKECSLARDPYIGIPVCLPKILHLSSPFLPPIIPQSISFTTVRGHSYHNGLPFIPGQQP